MDRTIKFRGWYTKRSRMYEVVSLYFPSDGGVYGVLVDRAIGIEWGNMRAGTDFDLMQFTGLQDRNGTDIYEGDMVVTVNEQQGSYPIEDEYRGVVTYIEDGFHIVQSHNKYRPTLRNLTIVSIEVVGNVYEHPHLLETSV